MNKQKLEQRYLILDAKPTCYSIKKLSKKYSRAKRKNIRKYLISVAINKILISQLSDIISEEIRYNTTKDSIVKELFD